MMRPEPDKPHQDHTSTDPCAIFHATVTTVPIPIEVMAPAVVARFQKNTAMTDRRHRRSVDRVCIQRGIQYRFELRRLQQREDPEPDHNDARQNSVRFSPALRLMKRPYTS